jgi:hypothetical protein
MEPYMKLSQKSIRISIPAMLLIFFILTLNQNCLSTSRDEKLIKCLFGVWKQYDPDYNGGLYQFRTYRERRQKRIYTRESQDEGNTYFEYAKGEFDVQYNILISIDIGKGISTNSRDDAIQLYREITESAQIQFRNPLVCKGNEFSDRAHKGKGQNTPIGTWIGKFVEERKNEGKFSTWEEIKSTIVISETEMIYKQRISKYYNEKNQWLTSPRFIDMPEEIFPVVSIDTENKIITLGDEVTSWDVHYMQTGKYIGINPFKKEAD